MDDVRLLDCLQQRLSHLEHKVQAYRHEMVLDFQRYYHDLLRDEPSAVTSSLHQSLTQTLSLPLSQSDYPLLGSDPRLLPDLDIPPHHHLHLADSRIIANPESGQRHPSMSMAGPSHTGSGAAEPSGSPRDHERELQGLFIPTYLPLLEASPTLPRSPPAVPLPPSPAAMLLPEPGIIDLGQDAGMDQRSSSPLSQDSPSVGTQSPSRPSNVRQLTDDTISSGVSDRSDTGTKVPRSALRRSSSASRPPQSPRRVRFEFQGAEVLPTASPQLTDFMTPHASSPDTSTEIVGTSSILDDEEGGPPPRKISSSEALRALSRAPLDQSTVWTVVTSNPDDIIVQQEDLSPIDSGMNSNNHFISLPAAPDPPPSAPRPMAIRTSPRLGSLSEEPEDESEQDDSSDDEFLSMAKPKSFTLKKAPNSPSLIQPTKEATPASPSSMGKKSSSEPKTVSFASPDESEAEEDDMFQFETEGALGSPKPRPKSLTIVEEDDEDEEDPATEDASETPQQSLYATSPAVAITRHSRSSGPPTPTSAKFQAGSLGSYKGRPVIMPVVRNPEVHAQAASLGQFNTFVGGLDGRSGMDEGDLSSFRASFANVGFSGTPRSFTERLMMEDARMNRGGNSDLSQ